MVRTPVLICLVTLLWMRASCLRLKRIVGGRPADPPIPPFALKSTTYIPFYYTTNDHTTLDIKQGVDEEEVPFYLITSSSPMTGHPTVHHIPTNHDTTYTSFYSTTPLESGSDTTNSESDAMTTNEPALTTNPSISSTESGKRVLVQGINLDDNVKGFLGIRYAEPPLGNLRLQRPRRMKLRGMVNATSYGSPCPQLSHSNGEIEGSEDCLFLNIFTPKGARQGDNLPVLFWLHGGHYKTGSGAQYYPAGLVGKGMIVVTINYRLGSLGFLSLGVEDLPGNVGLFDVSTAYLWIAKYIDFFGGDRRKIIAAGQGSGASLATLLALNSDTSPLVGGVLAMSGSAISPFSVDKNDQETGLSVGNLDGCTKHKVNEDFVRCIQELPVESLVRADANLKNLRRESSSTFQKLVGILTPGPAETMSDDRFLTSFIDFPALDALKDNSFPTNIPLLTGVTKQETATGIKGHSFHDFVNKLKSKVFLELNVFRELLQVNTGFYKNKTVDEGFKSLFDTDNYLKFFSVLTSKLRSDIDKLIKISTDALFNLPAFTTSHLWSSEQARSVYLYSFEEPVHYSWASLFLPGLALADQKSHLHETKEPSHGDDLMFLFQPRDIYGNAFKHEIMAEPPELMVSDDYKNMVYEFGRTGTPVIREGVSWSPFNPDRNNYMVITENPEEKENFNKCEMGLWSGDINILKSIECSAIGDAAQVVANVLGTAGSSLLKIAKGTGDLAGRLGAGIVRTADTGFNKITDLVDESPLSKPLDIIGSSLNGVPNPFKNTLTGLLSSSRQTTVSSSPTTAKFGLISKLFG